MCISYYFHKISYFSCDPSYFFFLDARRPPAETSDFKEDHKMHCENTTHHLLIKQRDGHREEDFSIMVFFSPRSFKCPSDLTRGE